jgi:hypothetical protein
MELPAGMVWFHVVTAALTWLALLWAVAAAGRPGPRRQALRVDAEAAAEPPLVPS